MRNLALSRSFVTWDMSWHADCRDDKDIKKTVQEAKCRWQYACQEVLICTYWGKNPIVQVILLNHLWMCSLTSLDHTRTLLENLLSLIVTHSNVLLKSPDTPARVWHLRWTQLTIPMWCSSNFAYSLMNRVTASSNSLASAVVNSDAYIFSLHWWISGMVCYMYRNNHR